MVRDRGFEPLTPSVSRKCSTTELTARPESTLRNRFCLSVMLTLSPKIERRASRFRTPALDEMLDGQEVIRTTVGRRKCCRLQPWLFESTSVRSTSIKMLAFFILGQSSTGQHHLKAALTVFATHSGAGN